MSEIVPFSGVGHTLGNKPRPLRLSEDGEIYTAPSASSSSQGHQTLSAGGVGGGAPPPTPSFDDCLDPKLSDEEKKMLLDNFRKLCTLAAAWLEHLSEDNPLHDRVADFSLQATLAISALEAGAESMTRSDGILQSQILGTECRNIRDIIAGVGVVDADGFEVVNVDDVESESPVPEMLRTTQSEPRTPPTRQRSTSPLMRHTCLRRRVRGKTPRELTTYGEDLD